MLNEPAAIPVRRWSSCCAPTSLEESGVHKEHVYGGLVLYERLQKVALYA
jgi:hypothetical protein